MPLLRLSRRNESAYLFKGFREASSSRVLGLSTSGVAEDFPQYSMFGVEPTSAGTAFAEAHLAGEPRLPAPSERTSLLPLLLFLLPATKGLYSE